jgi:hypothetical protein
MEIQKDFKELLELFGSRKIIDVDVYYLGREQLVQNKRALGRMKDLADLEALGDT